MQLTSDDRRRQQRHHRPSRQAGSVTRPTQISTLLSFPLSAPGGINTFVTGMLSALEREYLIDHRLIAPTAHAAEPKQLRRQLILAAHHFRQLLRERPDVVINHEHAVLLIAAVAYRLFVSPRARVVHSVHIQPVAPLSFFRRRVLGWLLARCTSVTAVSNYTAADVKMIAHPVPSRIDVIHGATNIEVRAVGDSAVSEFRRDFDLGKGPVICQVGPLNFPMKVAGVVRLIEAMAHVRIKHPQARLLIVGDGERRADAEDACRRAGVTDMVRITGFLQDVSLPLAAADIYCQMTLQDACPISLLEAMRTGKPIIAARTGGIPELIEDGINGLLVDVAPRAIAESLLRLLDDPVEATALGLAAAQLAGQRFTWERVAAEYAALLGLRAVERSA
jgi:L-malate glycosyltransferase